MGVSQPCSVCVQHSVFSTVCGSVVQAVGGGAGASCLQSEGRRWDINQAISSEVPAREGATSEAMCLLTESSSVL